VYNKSIIYAKMFSVKSEVNTELLNKLGFRTWCLNSSGKPVLIVNIVPQISTKDVSLNCQM